MTVSIRLDDELNRRLNTIARLRGVSKSDLIRQSLEAFLTDPRSAPTAWELGGQLFGRHGSGKRNLSRKRKEIVRKKIHAKHGGH